MSKKYFIKTFGCQMNVYDSSRIADMLKNEGYEEAKKQEDADLVLFNTCHIREKRRKSYFQIWEEPAKLPMNVYKTVKKQ